MPVPHRELGGLIHSYLGYDPHRFPPPAAEPPDLASAAMERMLMFGGSERLSEEDLAEAIEIDPSQIAGLGPSLAWLIAMLEERRRKLLSTFDPKPAVERALRAWAEAAAGLRVRDRGLRAALDRAVWSESIPELERLWWRVEGAEGERGLASGLMGLVQALSTRYEVEQLAARYDFTGRTELDIAGALEVGEELEAIDALLEQLREAMKTAKVGLIDLESLRRFVDEADVEQLAGWARHIQELVREQAELAGLEAAEGGYTLTPKAIRTYQSKVLAVIFEDLAASRSGRHAGPIEGEGVVELPSTRGYVFGDSAAHLDLPATVINAAVRTRAESGGRGGFSIRASDIQTHRTRNNPRAATAVIMDMSGSMRSGGQYIACKRMALALDGLIRTGFPGDHLSLIEMSTFARLRTIAEVPEMMPRPVTTRDPWVRLKVDLSNPRVSPSMIHPHFTNIEASLRLARRVLSGQDTPNRQIVLITDGLPTAHNEGDELYLLYPPDPRTERATMGAARACAREGIVINVFLVPSWSQDEDDIAFAHRLAEETRGRVFFTAGSDLDRFVVWDYVRRRRAVIG